MKKLISLILMLGLILTAMPENVSASERNSYTVILSDKLVEAGYRMSYGVDANCEKIVSDKNVVIGKKQFFDDETTKISGYPAINNGKDFIPLLVDFYIEDELISRPVYMANGDRYAPKPIDFGRKYANGTVIVVDYHYADVSYYDNDGTTLLSSEKVIASNHAQANAAANKEDETNDYIFNKWVNKDGSDALFTNLYVDMDVYASYTIIEKHIVTFNANGETLLSMNVSNGKTAQYDSVPVKETKTWEDEINTYETTYAFKGWSVNGDIVDPSAYEIKEATTFQAEFDETTQTTPKASEETPITPEEPKDENNNESEVTPVAPVTPIAPITPATPSVPEENENNNNEETTAPVIETPTVETTNTTTPIITALTTAPANTSTTNNTAAATAPITPVSEEIEENVTPLVRSLDNKEKATVKSSEKIEDEKTPLAKENTSNNILMIVLGTASLLAFFFLIILIKRNKKEEEANA